MVVFKRTPVVVSFDLPACPVCDAARGDPCRTPGNNTRMPHADRDRCAEYEGIVPSHALCWLPARHCNGGTSVHPCRLRVGHAGECNPSGQRTINARAKETP